MNKYEVVYIFHSSMTSEEIDDRLETLHSRLTRDAGQISAVEHWGKRQLAYPMEKQRSGYYVVAQFETEPAELPGFERILKLDDQLLRYLIVLSEGELLVPPSVRQEREAAASRAAPGGGGRQSDDKAAAEATVPAAVAEDEVEPAEQVASTDTSADEPEGVEAEGTETDESDSLESRAEEGSESEAELTRE